MTYDFGFLTTLAEFDLALSSHDAFLVYFNSNSCNVGKALAPKVMNLLKDKFPKMKFYYVNKVTSPDVAAQYAVFVEPTIITFFAGKETARKSRHFSMDEVEKAIERPYSLLFS